MIFLASTSPRRRALLKGAGIPFRGFRPQYQETHSQKKISPATLVKKHALEKALSIVPAVPKGLILGADTLVFFKGRIIGKPRNLREARQTLLALQGHWHTVYTGVALLRLKQGKISARWVAAEKTKVHLRTMALADIRRYFRRIQPLDKAGAYAIQSTRGSIVDCVQGSFSNAVGLPLEKLCAKLQTNF